jgi:hypothetical protein
MTPEEKAEELISKYITNQNSWYLENLVDGLRIAQAKQCALISVDEILNVLDDADDLIYYRSKFNFWTEVKNELEKI